MKFLEKIMDAISKEEKKQGSLYKISDIEIEKMLALNKALKEIENELLSIPATLALDNSIASEIKVLKNKDSLQIVVGYEKLMNDYFIACEDTSSEEYEYFENADSVHEVIDLVAEIIGKFIKRAGDYEPST